MKHLHHSRSRLGSRPTVSEGMGFGARVATAITEKHECVLSMSIVSLVFNLGLRIRNQEMNNVREKGMLTSTLKLKSCSGFRQLAIWAVGRK